MQALSGCASNETAPRQPANFTVDLTSTSNSALGTVGGAVRINDIYIIRTGTSTYVALSATCTHAGCTVNYNAGTRQFQCPCHGGTFDISGKVTGGPPPAALPQYQVTVDGNTLTIKG